jgi:glycosyltransferase involved in cell wall biosynthesis
MSISVCMATCNGAPFLREQVASILPQLDLADELIAVDDASSDATVAVLESFHDPRIRILRHAVNRGVIQTFEHALRESTGDILFLCDQDDRWHHDKVARVLHVFEGSPEITLVTTSVELIDGAGLPIGVSTKSAHQVRLGMIANLIKNRYQGCTMAFRRELLDATLPFPAGIPMHDSWIGLINACVGRAEYIAEPLVQYRRHGSTVTSGKRGATRLMVAQRWGLLRGLLGRTASLFRLRRRLKTACHTFAH